MSSLQCNLDLLKNFGKILMIFSFLGRFWWFFSILGQFWWFFNIWCLSICSKKIFHFWVFQSRFSVPIFSPDLRYRFLVQIFSPDFRSWFSVLFNIDFDDVLYFNFWFLVTISWGELLFKLLLKFFLIFYYDFFKIISLAVATISN